MTYSIIAASLHTRAILWPIHWEYTPAPPFDTTLHHHHSARFHLKVPMVTGCLVSQWMAVVVWFHERANLTGWLSSAEQIEGFVLFSFTLLRNGFWIFEQTNAANLNLKVFDKQHAWSTMGVWSSACVPALSSVLHLLLCSCRAFYTWLNSIVHHL